MTLRFSDLSVEQLRIEAAKYKELAQKAEQLGNMSEVAINERKMQVAFSYMLNPSDYHAGDIHQLHGDPGHSFIINYINGIFAWGHRINVLNEHYEKEEAIPVSILGQKINE